MADDPRIRQLYDELPYLAAYAKHTDLRVDEDPRAAVGGDWDSMGRRQLQFLVAQKLRPHHTVLDIGCGTLRAGRWLIRYLCSHRYTGVDISPRAIAAAWALVTAEGLADKSPQLLLNPAGRLIFSEFDQRFDYLLAHSVFTHLPESLIDECFRHVTNVMHAGSCFCFTFREAAAPAQTGLKDFAYPASLFEQLAAGNGLLVEDRSVDFGHPRGQRMMIATLRTTPREQRDVADA